MAPNEPQPRQLEETNISLSLSLALSLSPTKRQRQLLARFVSVIINQTTGSSESSELEIELAE